MKKTVQVALAVFFALTLAAGVQAAGGGGGADDGSAPFPVPLVCYTQHDAQQVADAHCDRLGGVEKYKDPEGAGVGAILSNRISSNPFNLVASLIFLCAILHTFAAAKFLAAAHAIHHEHEHAMKAKGASEEEIERTAPMRVQLYHFLGEAEVVFGLWVIVLMVFTIFMFDWGTFKNYLAHTVNFIEPMFVVVIMALASTRPVVKLAEQILGLFAGLGGHTPAAWWFSILMIAPLLGSFITEPAAMTIAALLLSHQIYNHNPSPRLAYATIGLLFVNVSVGGTLTHFAAPPVLMVAAPWDFNMGFMFSHYGWKAAVGIFVANVLYFVIFRGDLNDLASKAAGGEDVEEEPVPVWITIVHLLFMGWTVFNAHYPPLFIGGFLLFLGFVAITHRYQSPTDIRSPLLVGFFLAGLVTHGGLQAWWIAPVLGAMDPLSLMGVATVLTAFNDNAAITYLSTLVPGFSIEAKYMVVAGAVTGGGLTVIANAPNPAGQSILQKFYEGGVNPGKLAAYALIPTLIMAAAFILLEDYTTIPNPQAASVEALDSGTEIAQLQLGQSALTAE